MNFSLVKTSRNAKYNKRIKNLCRKSPAIRNSGMQRAEIKRIARDAFFIPETLLKSASANFLCRRNSELNRALISAKMVAKYILEYPTKFVFADFPK
ncbi:MAG: hypothetical protein AABW72_02585 [archaeon]